MLKIRTPFFCENDLCSFFNLIHTNTGFDISGYSKPFIIRRLTSEMSKQRTPSFNLFLNKLKMDQDLLFKVYRSLTINYTEFFRNPIFYDSLRKKVFPFLSTFPTINIWVAGCSTGEEAYSLAILLNEVGLLSRSQIIATDVNEDNLVKADSGIFSANQFRNVTGSYLNSGGKKEISSYYTFAYDKVIFRDEIKRHISFLKHDFSIDQSFSSFNLILCRNVMIYFGKELQNRTVSIFNQSLFNLGYLALGIQENLLFNPERTSFSLIDHSTKIYRKINYCSS